MVAKGKNNIVLSLSQKMQGLLLEYRIFRSILQVKLARLHHKRLVIIVGTASHNNIGDLAITYAQTKFIDSLGKNFISISMSLDVVMYKNQNILKKLVKYEDILMGHGGGNMGDMYLREENCRRELISRFPNNKIIIFPQTIHFSDTKTGQEELAKTKKIYAKHKDLTVIAREQHSHEIMQRVFKANKVMLIPDIVLSLNSPAENNIRNGLLICLRNDDEAKINLKDKTAIAIFSEKHFDYIRHTDTISHIPLFNYRSKTKVVENKLLEFKSAQLIITDRLHGMVFAAITGTPCIALASFNHKVTNTFMWLNYLPYIKFCDDINNIQTPYNQIEVNKSYNYSPEHFNKFWNELKDVIQSVAIK